MAKLQLRPRVRHTRGQNCNRDPPTGQRRRQNTARYLHFCTQEGSFAGNPLQMHTRGKYRARHLHSCTEEGKNARGTSSFAHKRALARKALPFMHARGRKSARDLQFCTHDGNSAQGTSSQAHKRAKIRERPPVLHTRGQVCTDTSLEPTPTGNCRTPATTRLTHLGFSMSQRKI